MNNSRGIDTIQLFTSDFEMEKSHLQDNFISQFYINKETGEKKDKYFNNFKYDTTDKKSSHFNIDIENGYLSIKASIPKYLKNNNDNTELAKISDLKEYKEKIKKQLNDLYIDTDISQMKINRLDITNNASMKYKSIEYISFLKNFNVNRIKDTGKSFFNTTATWKNGNKAICIYDKVNEQDKKTISNILRNEIRFFKTKNIVNTLNVNCYNDLVNDFDNVCSRARQFEIDNLFNKENLEQVQKKEKESLNILVSDYVKEKGNSKNLLNYLIVHYGIVNLVKQNESIDNILSVIMANVNIKNYDYMRNYKARIKKQLNDLYIEHILKTETKSKILYIDLYNECLQKLVA